MGVGRGLDRCDTWVEGGVYDLLGGPQVGRHLGDLVLLVLRDEIFGMLKTGRGGQERSGSVRQWDGSRRRGFV